MKQLSSQQPWSTWTLYGEELAAIAGVGGVNYWGEGRAVPSCRGARLGGRMIASRE